MLLMHMRGGSMFFWGSIEVLQRQCLRLRIYLDLSTETPWIRGFLWNLQIITVNLPHINFPVWGSVVVLWISTACTPLKRRVVSTTAVPHPKWWPCNMCLNDATSVGIYCIVCYKTINEQFLNTMYFRLCGLFINVEVLYMLGSQREQNLLTLAWCGQCIMIWCDFMWHVVVCRLWNRIIRYHMKWYVSVSRRTCIPCKQVNLCSWQAIYIYISDLLDVYCLPQCHSITGSRIPEKL